MRASRIALAVTAFGLATGAGAVPCYVIFDRNDVVIYRDVNPPFDLSETNSPQRMALRQRGHHLMVAEFDQCFSVGHISATTGATTATVDEIVAQLRPAIDTSIGKPGGNAISGASSTASTTPGATHTGKSGY